MKTHEVLNQPPPLVDYNLFTTDKALMEALEREGGGWARQAVSDYAKKVGSEEVIRWGFQANQNPPVLKTHDRYGNRVDMVEFHPAWHELMKLSVNHALHSLPWREPKKGSHVVRAAMYLVGCQNEQGHFCPVTMTFAVVPALRKQPELAKEWESKILSTEYDPRFLPSSQKKGVIFGMGMTEKQGGSDVRSNTTRAVPVGKGGPGGEYLLTGHKWFCSAPMSDAFLVLAQAPGGLSCFVLPRWTPDGKQNVFQIQRLKDKLGNRSNASSEVEFEGTWARLLGEEGRGVPAIIEMVNHTRFDCVLGSAACMRQALAQATHHAHYRSAFGKVLESQPLMMNVLTDLALESEAATVLAMRLARAFDQQKESESESAFRRLATAISKYWVCKRLSPLMEEAIESLGGAGYVEESILPRIYREAPLNSIWEGSGNVNCLDVLRAMSREPATVAAFFEEVEKGKGIDPRLDRTIDVLKSDLQKLSDFEPQARRIVERMVLALQASLLVRHSPSIVADAFCRSRLDRDWGQSFGTLSPQTDFKFLIERARPAL
jgi:putative acyl-CoA dehydrogenase